MTLEECPKIQFPSLSGQDQVMFRTTTVEGIVYAEAFCCKHEGDRFTGYKLGYKADNIDDALQGLLNYFTQLRKRGLVEYYGQFKEGGTKDA